MKCACTFAGQGDVIPCEKCHWSTVCCFAGLLVGVALLLLRLRFNCRLFGRRRVLFRHRRWSSSAPPSSWSCTLVVWVVCSCVVGWVVVVVVMEVAGRVGCLSLLAKVVFHESHVKPSCAAVSQLVSLVRSLLSRWTLVGCNYELMSPSHLLASCPCFWYTFCLVDIAIFQLDRSSVSHGPDENMTAQCSSVPPISTCRLKTNLTSTRRESAPVRWELGFSLAARSKNT